MPSQVSSIKAALTQVSSNGWGYVKIVVAEGYSEGSLTGNWGVFDRVLVQAETAYTARITNIDVGGGDKAQNIVFEDFEIGNAEGIVIKLDGGRTTDQNVHHISFRNTLSTTLDPTMSSR